MADYLYLIFRFNALPDLTSRKQEHFRHAFAAFSVLAGEAVFDFAFLGAVSIHSMIGVTRILVQIWHMNDLLEVTDVRNRRHDLVRFAFIIFIIARHFIQAVARLRLYAGDAILFREVFTAILVPVRLSG